MQNLRVHFTHRQHPDQPLRPGVHRIVRHASGTVRLADDSPGTLLLAQFCLDDRGLWLQVATGIRGIHVNGRPVRRMALLRPGDAVYADGVEMVVQGECEALAQAPARSDEGGDDPRLLRGVGGQHHGRSFTLDRPRVIGSSVEADIVIDDPAFAEQHARLERHGERLLLRDLGAGESTRVNGITVRHCWLQPGDQLVFDAQHRFVLEVPHDGRRRAVEAEEDEPLDAPADADVATTRPRVQRWPWLLASAVLLAGAISGLLWFGAR
ncbi:MULTISPECIES: FHA domain-containing protein [Stenotrophomonas]|uniref:FHA domain-containing protein n=1 Tax=Stenotrophomonas maltophilia TaxID=40324 RepID=A0A4S2CXG7_STEMA|nr:MULTISPECIES: FHA domain-containing protein [Stenotrophomonas]MBD3828478.1 FHA domain-containing protein [Stenotrophomonas sp.]TGY33669.1 FHA domain-containing protein [Stenotrophomonas maltophilia]